MINQCAVKHEQGFKTDLHNCRNVKWLKSATLVYQVNFKLSVGNESLMDEHVCMNGLKANRLLKGFPD